MLVCTRGQRLRWIGSLGCFNRYYNITDISLSAPACTDMVYSKELERDITTTAMAKAILRLKTLAFIPSYNMIGSIFLRPKDE